MNYDVTITILDSGWLVKDKDYTIAVAQNNGAELLNVLARIKKVVKTEEEQ